MRFLTDMGIGVDVVVALRARGHDALHLREEGLQRLGDDQILAKARAESRIVLTHDLDMGRLLAAASAAGPSVITFRLSDMRPSSVMAHLLPALEAFAQELAQGAAISISDAAARCHLLPFSS